MKKVFLSIELKCFSLQFVWVVSLYHWEEPGSLCGPALGSNPLLVPVWHQLQTCLTSCMSVMKTLNSRDSCDAPLSLHSSGPLGRPCPSSCYPLIPPILPGCFPNSVPSDHNILSWIEECHRKHFFKQSFLTRALSNLLGKKKLNPSERAGAKHRAWESLPAPVSVAPQRQSSENSVLLPALTDDCFPVG